MKIYTRRGDGGQTDLFGGGRVAKDTPRVEAYGSVDELNAFVGLAASYSSQPDVTTILSGVQRALFRIGSRLACVRPESAEAGGRTGLARDLDAGDVALLERAIDDLESELEPLRAFVLPGGSRAAAALHVARTVCRRAERLALRLGREEELGDLCLPYLNRLSDLLFVLARVENRRAGVVEPEWSGRDDPVS